jgi:hypothetical protein
MEKLEIEIAASLKFGSDINSNSERAEAVEPSTVQ